MKFFFLLLAEDDDDNPFLLSQTISLADPQVVCIVVNNGKELITRLKMIFSPYWTIFC